jgi:hypothetical protein
MSLENFVGDVLNSEQPSKYPSTYCGLGLGTHNETEDPSHRMPVTAGYSN